MRSTRGARSRASKRIDAEVTAFVKKVRRELKPERISRVVLFGSRARGDVHEGSDADFLVVADFQQRFFDRISRLLNLNQNAKIEINVFPYTPEEFARMRAQRNPFIERALREGITL
jgi:predicted nucleotidyltransferase